MTPQSNSEPDFLIVGAAKCGTSSLVANLDLHPDAYMHPGEAHYFTKHRDRGDEWYFSLFKHPGKLQGEKSPSYFFYINSHERIYRMLPDAKLIVMLREPVQRAYSNWNMRLNDNRLIRHGLEYNRAQPKENRLKRLDFDAITDYALTAPRDKQPLLFDRPLDVIDRGIYVIQLKSLLEFYPPEKIMVVITEQYYRDEQKGYDAVCRFLGLSPFQPPTFEKRLVAEYKQTIPTHAAKKLREFFRPYNEELFQLLGYRVPEWENQ